MAAPFPYPDNNITGIVSFFRHVNTLTDVGGAGFLGIAILIIIGFVAFLSMKNYTTERAFGFAGFLTFIVAILLRFMNMISDSVLFIVIIMFIMSIVFLMKERQSEEV